MAGVFVGCCQAQGYGPVEFVGCDVGSAVGDEVDRVAFLDGDWRRIGCGLAADDVPGADDAGAGGDDAAADAVAVWLRVAEDAFDV